MRFAVISGLWYGSEITPGAEADRAGAFGGDGDEQLRRADHLPAGGMVLADPGLVEAEPVEPLHQLEIAVHAGGGVLVHRMERRQEDAVAELDWVMTGLGNEQPALCAACCATSRWTSSAAPLPSS